MHENVNLIANRVEQLFPKGTKITCPKGGYTVWISLPKEIDTGRTLSAMFKKGVAFMPGRLFSGDPISTQCIRLNGGVPMDARAEKALNLIAKEASQLLGKK